MRSIGNCRQSTRWRYGCPAGKLTGDCAPPKEAMDVRASEPGVVLPCGTRRFVVIEGLLPPEHDTCLPAAETSRPLTAVLFVDIVEATPLAVSLGDRTWAELLEQYHELVRDALEQHRGRLMDTAGDGFFAIFDETADAVRCALEIRLAARRLGLELRSGVHLGHCWQADEKCAGADVHVGARLASSATPGELLVSEEAAEQVRQAGIAITERGARSLKGLPGTWRIFAAGAEPQGQLGLDVRR